MGNRIPLRFGVFAICAAVGWFATDFTGSAAGSDKVVEYETGDLTMNGAQAEAQRHLPSFLANMLNEQGLAEDSAMVKVAFPVTIAGVDGHEVIWVGPFGKVDGSFKGLLANRPRDMQARLAMWWSFPKT